MTPKRIRDALISAFSVLTLPERRRFLEHLRRRTDPLCGKRQNAESHFVCLRGRWALTRRHGVQSARPEEEHSQPVWAVREVEDDVLADAVRLRPPVQARAGRGHRERCPLRNEACLLR